MFGKFSARLRREARLLRGAWISLGFLALLVCIQLVPAISGIWLIDLQYSLGLFSANVSLSESWKWLGYALVHGHVTHLLINGVAIFMMGPRIESYVPKRFFARLMLYSILAGGFAFYLLTPPEMNTLLIGSSAFVFGLFVFLATVSPESRLLPFFLSARWAGKAVIIGSLILAVRPWLVPRTFEDPSPFDFYLYGISHSCHFGGAMVGWIFAKIHLRPRVSLKALQKSREKSER